MDVARAVGTVLGGLGVDAAFGVVGSGNFAVTRALQDAGVRCRTCRACPRPARCS
jgi:acetolactate synthase I/II/III large subunit